MSTSNKTRALIAVVFASAVLSAFIFPLRRPNLDGVHPAFANLAKPVHVSAVNYYGDGGSLSLQAIDGSGLTNFFAIPIRSSVDGPKYPHFVVGVKHIGTNNLERIPLDQKTKAYVCFLLENNSPPNSGADFALVYLRGAPRDYLPIIVHGLRKLSPFN